MPHFVIDCSENIIASQKPVEIMQAVYDTAAATGLFADGDIKVRINAFKHFKLAESKDSFIHVFAYIMEGRSIEQKSDLSEKIIIKLKSIFPNVPVISININDFEKATYYNRSMV